MILRKIILNIDDKRELLEDFIADEILKRLDESDTLNTLEEKGILAAFSAADAYLLSYNVPTLPADVQRQIAKAVVKGIGNANKKLQKQLKKKSKSFEKRHSEGL